ncbi:MAG TPA: signal peptidase I [Candidatus Gallacutalibacter stercoravium]|nr:signal peptidase I [Candidatus Gallacutalibacter stercoravium]
MEDNVQEQAEIQQPGHNPQAGSLIQSCFEWLEALIAAIVIVVVLLTFFFRTVNVSGPSMENTLQDQDRVLLTSWGYTPEPGDIVVITRAAHLEEPLVKRVIAVEGQTLHIDYDTGNVYVDGVLLNEPYIKNATTTPGDWEIPSVIPEGYVFVMGDNRQISKDSRYEEVGLIDERNILGKVQFIFYPFDRIGGLY